jgi:hypothetical protein
MSENKFMNFSEKAAKYMVSSVTDPSKIKYKSTQELISLRQKIQNNPGSHKKEYQKAIQRINRELNRR